MKNLISLLLFCISFACSSGGKESSSQDSTSIAKRDSSGTTSSNEATAVESESAQDPLEFEYSKRAGEMDSLSSKLSTVTISSSGYEAQADITWLFNDNMKPRYYKQTYAVEGMEGSIEYYIENDQVICALSVENIVTNKWCQTTNGTRTMEGDQNVTVLDKTFGAQETKKMKQYLQELTTLLASLEVVSNEGDAVTLRREEEENYGEVKSKSAVEVSLPKKVYDALK